MSVQVEVENSHSFSEKPPEKQNIDKPFTSVPFGKYVHIPFEELSKLTEIKNGKIMNTGINYMKWLNSQDWVKPNLKSAIEPYIK